MSRRASLFAKDNPGKERPKVRFPDELVFLDNVKENDAQAVHTMLRRASIQIDINAIGDSGVYHIDLLLRFASLQFVVLSGIMSFDSV